MSQKDPEKSAHEFLLAEDVGAAIATLRGEKTQKDCARKAGMERSSWNQYEKGRSFPQLQTIERIAHGLGVEVVELTEAVIRAWSLRVKSDVSGARKKQRVFDFKVIGQIELEDAEELKEI